MKQIILHAIICFVLNPLIGQVETVFSFGMLHYKLSLDDSGYGYDGTFNEYSKNTAWASVKIAPWGKRHPFNFELRLKHKTGSMSSEYGGQAFPSYSWFDYKQYRLSTEARYRFRLFKLNSFHAELGGFIDVPIYSEIEGGDDGHKISHSGDEFMKKIDTGFSAVICASHMFSKHFGINAQFFANQSVRWNWHHNLYPIRDTGFGIGAIWRFEED